MVALVTSLIHTFPDRSWLTLCLGLRFLVIIKGYSSIIGKLILLDLSNTTHAASLWNYQLRRTERMHWILATVTPVLHTLFLHNAETRFSSSTNDVWILFLLALIFTCTLKVFVHDTCRWIFSSDNQVIIATYLYFLVQNWCQSL